MQDYKIRGFSDIIAGITKLLEMHFLRQFSFPPAINHRGVMSANKQKKCVWSDFFNIFDAPSINYQNIEKACLYFLFEIS